MFAVRKTETYAKWLAYGPGYRVYFKKTARTIIVLLAGGDKRSQSDDVQTALRLARNL